MNTPELFVGLDIGTSGVKALVIDHDQKVVAETNAPLSVSRPSPNWSEQDPKDWLTACDTCMSELSTKGVAMGQVIAIGLSGQMHGATTLDKSGQVIRPAILWNDTRSHLEAAEMDADPLFRDVSGNVVFPGFTAPKLAWMKQNEPDAFAQVAKVLLPKDYVRFWLTGDMVGEMSDAAGTSWLDVGKRKWSAELLEKTGLSKTHMPDLVEGSEVSGTVKPELANRWGLNPKVVVAGGGGDNAAAACGLGVVDDGQAFVSLGTSGVLFAPNDAYRPAPETAVHTFCHALPGQWHQMGVILSASDAMTWYAGIIGQSPADLTAALGTTLRAPGTVQFLPYLSGERTPHNDAGAMGSFSGLTHATDRQSLTHSVLQGVGFALRDCNTALGQTGTCVRSCLATGGGANSVYWLKLLATQLNMPIDVAENANLGAAFGAARLAMMAGGASAAAVMTAPVVSNQIQPDPDLISAYDTAYETYKSLFPAIRSC